jgi:DnaJ family protein C protein 8
MPGGDGGDDANGGGAPAPAPAPAPPAASQPPAPAAAGLAGDDAAGGSNAPAPPPAPPPAPDVVDDDALLAAFFAEVKATDRDAEVGRVLGAFKLNPYEQVGVRFDATPAEVTRAYRKVRRGGGEAGQREEVSNKGGVGGWGASTPGL